jgi:hypothetical protein
MSKSAVSDNSSPISLTRGNIAISSSDLFYIPGETLTLSIANPADGKLYIFQASNAKFIGGICSLSRIINTNSASVVMPASGQYFSF